MASESPINAIADVTRAAITEYTKTMSHSQMVELLLVFEQHGPTLRSEGKDPRDGNIDNYCNIWRRKAKLLHPHLAMSVDRDQGFWDLKNALSELISLEAFEEWWTMEQDKQEDATEMRYLLSLLNPEDWYYKDSRKRKEVVLEYRKLCQKRGVDLSGQTLDDTSLALMYHIKTKLSRSPNPSSQERHRPSVKERLS